MDIFYLTGEQLQLAFLPYRRDGRYAATFFLKQAFEIANGKAAVPLPEDDEPAFPLGDTRAEDGEEGSLLYASDFAPHKPRADVLLKATATAPAGSAVPTLDVRMRVGGLTKALRVFGERRWKWSVLRGDAPGSPEPFSSLPITYENAFGGAEWRRNPVGKGRGGDAELLPNIELPDNLVKSRRDKIEPAGFGPLDPEWQQRKSLVGTYDETWLKTRWPWYPEDFDFGFFNAAPRDQQVEGYLRGDEALEFENLHAEHPLYRSQLPGLAARCFLYERLNNGQASFREVPLVLDTLWIDLNAERLVLVWRGNVPVRSLKLREIERVIVSTESLSDPRSVEHYHQAMHAHMAAEEAEFDVDEEMWDTTEEDAATEREFAEMEAEFAAMEEEFQKLGTQAAAEEAEARERHIGGGVDPALFERTPEQADAIPQQVDQVQELRKVRPALADEVAALQMEARQAEESEKQFDEEFAAAEAEFADEPPWTRERVVECYEAGESIGEADLDELDLSGLSLCRADFANASLRKAVLKGTDLSEANLDGVDLTGADLSEANLSGAVLDDADLTDAKLQGATVTNSSLSGADLSGLDLKGLDFSGARGKYTEFSGADLTGAKFVGAAFDGADFDETILEDAEFRHAVLKECDLSSAKAAGAVFEDSDLTNIRCENGGFTGANFRKVKAVGSVWEQAVLDKADFTGSILRNSEFSDAIAREAVFDRADCTECSFADAQLQAARLTRCNLLRASFARADLRQADIEDANCYEADFLDAVLEDFRHRGANLKLTLLAERGRG